MQVASVGLVNAVDRFDPDRGFAFTSFAVPTIVGELKRHFRDHGWALHVARGARDRAQAIAEAQAAIRAEAGRAPSIGELAQYLELSTEDVADGLQTIAAREPVSLDAPIAVDDGSPVSRADSIGDLDGRLRLTDERLTLLDAAGRLPKREREVLYLRFGADLTQTEIAERVGVSQMQVSRLLRRSLVRMREQLAGERRTPDRFQSLLASVPPSTAAGEAALDAADEESEHPEHQGHDQHDPQDVRGEAEPTEDRKDQQQRNQRNHLFYLLVMTASSGLQRSATPGRARPCTGGHAWRARGKTPFRRVGV